MKFFFHYNKPKSNQMKRPQISLHYKNQCSIIDNIIINVPTRGKIKTRQPLFVVMGDASSIIIENGIATIN